MRALLIGAIVAAFAVGNSKGDKDDAKQALMDADKAFNKATTERKLDGWMEFFADDAVRISPLGDKATVGRDAIRMLDGKMIEDLRLEWAPVDAGAFADGKHGFTTGKGKAYRKTDGGAEELVAEVVYVTMWRKDGDKWKVILDTGARADKVNDD
jgi:ketosteroid isomerase-like protein